MRPFLCLQGVLVPVRVMKHNDAGVRVRLEGGPGLFGFVPADYVTDDVLPIDPITGQVCVGKKNQTNRLSCEIEFFIFSARHIYIYIYNIYIIIYTWYYISSPTYRKYYPPLYQNSCLQAAWETYGGKCRF